MTIMDLLKEKELSRYSLSKISGVPWEVLSDICAGKTNLAKCDAQTLLKLSKALHLSILGKPKDKTYLERNLSNHLTKSINDYIQGESVITEEQANYLRTKYLYGEE